MFAKSKASIGNQAQMDALCTQATIAPHQVVVYEIAKLMASVPPERLGEHRALLTWYSAGAGKTISSIAVILAFWATKKNIFIVSSLSNINQAIASYKQDAPKFFPMEVRAIAHEYKSKHGAKNMSDAAAFSAALDTRISGLSFVKARNRLAAKAGEFKTVKSVALDAGEGSVLIIDEAQGLSVYDKNTDKKGDAVKLGCALRALTKEKMRKINVFAMTATPGSNIKAWLKLLSIVRRADQAPFTLDDNSGGYCTSPPKGMRDDALALEKMLKVALEKGPNSQVSQNMLRAITGHVRREFFGLVSYVDIRSDLSRHACVEESDALEKFTRVQMDRESFIVLLQQNAADRRSIKTKSEEHKFVFNPSEPNVFANNMRKWGSAIPKSSCAAKMSAAAMQHMQSTGRVLTINRSQYIVSPKFAKLAQFIAMAPGKHYVYMLSGNHAVLAHALLKWHKMVDVTGKADVFNGARVNAASNKIVGLAPNPKRNNIIVLRSKTETEQRNRLVKIFNHPANADGSYIRVVIATDQLYEGLDLKGLRYVSLGDVLPTPLQEIQGVGRGVRFCSHRGLPLKDRRVTIMRWLSMAPSGGWPALQEKIQSMKGFGPRSAIGINQVKDEYERLRGKSFDEMVFNRARYDPDFNLLSNFERVMKAAAIDCSVLAPFHPGSSCSVATLSRSNPISAGTRCKT